MGSIRPPAGGGFLPNLLIVGAAKSGTTSLHEYLSLHPEIFMSTKKELQLFSRDDWRKRLGWYRAQFPVGALVRGESSPSYSMDPVLPHVPERMHSIVPRARILYLVRDPIERLGAHWVEFFSLRLESRSLTEALADYDSPSNVYVMTSRYAHQLTRYREWFPDAQIMVLDQRELRDARRETLRSVFAFLGVDDDFWSSEFDRVHNAREIKLRYNDFGRWLYRVGIVSRKHPGVASVARRVRWRGFTVIGREITRPQIDEHLRDELRACLRDDVARLRSYTGRSFEHWSV